MPLLNYRTKIWPKSRAGWTKDNKDKQIEGIENADKKYVRTFFFVRTKGYLPPSRILPEELPTLPQTETKKKLESEYLLYYGLLLSLWWRVHIAFDSFAKRR